MGGNRKSHGSREALIEKVLGNLKGVLTGPLHTTRLRPIDPDKKVVYEVMEGLLGMRNPNECQVVEDGSNVHVVVSPFLLLYVLMGFNMRIGI